MKWKVWLLSLMALLSCCGCSWLRKRSKSTLDSSFVSTVTSGYRNCPSQQATCWCGTDADRRETFINVRQCPFSTKWGSLCEPCVTAEQLCQRLQQCARCMRDNANAICAECPPDRHGLYCEKERPCKTPNVTEFMTVHPHFTKRGTYKLEFRCTGGRVRHGHKILKCLTDSGTWNREPPKCVLPKLCSTLPTPPIAFTRVKQQTSERVLYECDEGYVTSSSVLETALQCENGVWVQIGESVKCEPGPKCTSLPTLLGARPVAGTPVKSVYRAGESVQYECQEGFEPVAPGANFIFTCVDKQWDGQFPECELKGCPRLIVGEGEVVYHEQSNSRGVSPYAPINTRAVVRCHDGHMVQGLPEVTCLSTGQWHPSVPKCMVRTCHDVPQGKTCTLSVSSDNVIALTNRTEIYPGETVMFGCKEGTFRWRGQGNAQRECFYNGTAYLSGSEIVCRPGSVCKIDTSGDAHLKVCRGPGCRQLGHDQVKDRNFDFPKDVISLGGRVEYSCDRYYRLDGNDTETCLLDKLNKPLNTPRCLEVCGRRRLSKDARIMGGKESRGIEEWPWQAGLWQVRGNQAGFLCGATLIYDQWAVTAAHCVTIEGTNEALMSKGLRVTSGQSLKNESESRAIRSDDHKGASRVARIIVHSKYDCNTLDNDIALVKLRAPLEMSFHVGVACLPASLDCSDQRLVEGNVGTVTGWGMTEYDDYSNTLREVTLGVANRTECVKHFNDNERYNTDVLTDNMFCAKSNSTTSDPTDGDSGGPFVMQGANSKDWVLEGIVSWGAHNDDEKRPYVNSHSHVKIASDNHELLRVCRGKACYGGYTRVAKYLQWIKNVTGRSQSTSHRCA